MRTRPGLEPMLEARSVAVVGASIKEGSLGRAMIEELVRGGYEGSIYPVNPGYDEVLGIECYPGVAETTGRRGRSRHTRRGEPAHRAGRA